MLERPERRPIEERPPVGERLEDLGPPDGTLDVPPPRTHTAGSVARAPPFLLLMTTQLLLLFADVGVVVGGLIYLVGILVFGGALLGVPLALTISLHLGLLGEALLLVFVPLSMAGWILIRAWTSPR